MKASTSHLFLPLAWTFALTGLLIAGLAVAAEPTTPAAAAENTENSEATIAQETTDGGEVPQPPMAGLRVVIDPETGQAIIPPPAERRQMVLTPEMQNALSQSSAGLNQVVLPDGTAFVRLQGRFQNLLFATVDEEGQIKVDHALPDGTTVEAEERVGADQAEAANTKSEVIHD